MLEGGGYIPMGKRHKHPRNTAPRAFQARNLIKHAGDTDIRALYEHKVG